MNAYCQHDLVYPQCPICKDINARYTVRSIEQRETVQPQPQPPSQPANLLLEDDDKPMYTCKFCGAPSWYEPSEQSPPPDYCHESDHGSPEDHKDFE